MIFDKHIEQLESSHLLIVDDDERIRDLLGRYLHDKGFLVTTSENAQDARDKLKDLQFDLLVVDIMMPGEDGLSLTRFLREEFSHIPVLLLTALAETKDKIDGLEMGADDYLTKPFEPAELLLRIKAILRRTEAQSVKKQSEVLSLGKWDFDVEREEIYKKGTEDYLSLTTVEKTLLLTLGQKQNRIISRDELAKLSGADSNSRTIDVQVTRLRKKIEKDPKNPRYLQTVRGRGYILKPDAS